MKKTSRKIVAIGGGALLDRKYQRIIREIRRLSGKKHPKVLRIPTASSDARTYDAVVRKVFCDKLGCQIDHLYLIEENPTLPEIRKKILGADIIFVGGGNTLKMMRLWRRRGVDKVLVEAWKKGIVLSGISAGAICWFDGGHSDSLSFYNPRKWKYIRVAGMGLIRGVACPHYNGDTGGKMRRESFAEMMRGLKEPGLAIEDNCALEIVDGTFRVFSAQKGANVYRVCRRSKAVISEKIPVRSEFSPITRLYSSGKV